MKRLGPGSALRAVRGDGGERRRPYFSALTAGP